MKAGLQGRNDQPGWTPEASPGGTSIPHHQGAPMVEADQGLSWLGSTAEWPFRSGFTETWLSMGLWRLWDITEALLTLNERGGTYYTSSRGWGLQYVHLNTLNDSVSYLYLHFWLSIEDRVKDQIWICLAPMSMPHVLILFLSFQYNFTLVPDVCGGGGSDGLGWAWLPHP